MVIRLFKNNKCVFSGDDVDLMLVEDSQGNPVSLAAKLGFDRTFVVATINEEAEFNNLLRQLGLDKTVVAVSPHLKPPDQLPYVVS